jgi:hypothetical protein
MVERIEATPVAYPFSFVVAGGSYHAVELTIAESGAVTGRVLQAFDAPGGAASASADDRRAAPVALFRLGCLLGRRARFGRQL